MPCFFGAVELDLPPALSPLPLPLPLPLAEVRPPLLLLPLMVLSVAVEVPVDSLLLGGSPVPLMPWLGLLESNPWVFKHLRKAHRALEARVPASSERLTRL